MPRGFPIVWQFTCEVCGEETDTQTTSTPEEEFECFHCETKYVMSSPSYFKRVKEVEVIEKPTLKELTDEIERRESL